MPYLSSPKTYNLFRQIIPCRAFQNLYDRLGTNITQEKNNLIDLDVIDSVIKNYILENDLDVTKPGTNIVVLAIDAFAFKSFGTTAMTANKNPEDNGKEIIYNNGFIYLMIPVDYHYPKIILRIEKYQNGNIIDNIASRIKEIIKDNGLLTWFHATDGDRFLSEMNSEFFRKYVNKKTSNFMTLVKSIYEDLQIPVGDPLHLWKSVRTRHQTHSINLFADSDSSTDCKSAKMILDIVKSLDDCTDAGRMRDPYCIKLFSLKNVCKLLTSSHFMDAALLFPFSLWIAADFSVAIDLNFRLFLLELAFQMINTFKENFIPLKENGIL